MTIQRQRIPQTEIHKAIVDGKGFKSATDDAADIVRRLVQALEQVFEDRLRLQTALANDETDLWTVTNGILKEIMARDWVTMGRGGYEWDDDRYRDETLEAFNAVRELIKGAQGPAARRYHQVLRETGGT